MASFRVFTPKDEEYWYHGESTYRLGEGGTLLVENEDGELRIFSPSGWTLLVAESSEPVIDVGIL